MNGANMHEIGSVNNLANVISNSTP